MKYEVRAIDQKSWCGEIADIAMSSAFGESRPHHIDRSNFALVCFKDDVATGFVTCIEMDSETIYWQFGGAFGETQNTRSVVPCYIALIDWCAEKYLRITTRIENDNVRMLHLAMKMGFRVVGTWNFKNKIYLELLNEVKNGND